MNKIAEILEELVNNSAGCICIEYKDGDCPCSKEKRKAVISIINYLMTDFEKLNFEHLVKKSNWLMRQDAEGWAIGSHIKNLITVYESKRDIQPELFR